MRICHEIAPFSNKTNLHLELPGCLRIPLRQAPPRLRIWTLGLGGFRGPGFRSARQVLCGDASRLFLKHFPKHLSSVLGRTELSHEVRDPRPQKHQIIRNEDHHLALFECDPHPQNLPIFHLNPGGKNESLLRNSVCFSF